MNLALEAMDRKDYPAAISALNKCLELDLDDNRPIRAINDIHIITKKYDESNADIDYLLWLDPNDEDAKTAKELLTERIHYSKC